MLDVTNDAPRLEEIESRLRSVIDPEIGINIVDLGLIYDTAVDDRAIVVTMTMTTPACPLGPYLEQAVDGALGEIAGHRLIAVEITFSPPWTPEMITPEGREQLGWSV